MPSAQFAHRAKQAGLNLNLNQDCMPLQPSLAWSAGLETWTRSDVPIILMSEYLLLCYGQSGRGRRVNKFVAVYF